MITLRKFNEGDLNRLVELLNNKNVSQFTSDRIPFPYTVQDAERFLSIAIKGEGDVLQAILWNEKLIGGIGIHPQPLNASKNVEIGYWIGEEYWGKGFTMEAVRLIIHEVFRNPDIHKIMARTLEGNSASEKILIKSGFQLEGELKEHIFKRGKFLNEKYWGLLRSNYKP